MMPLPTRLVLVSIVLVVTAIDVSAQSDFSDDRDIAVSLTGVNHPPWTGTRVFSVDPSGLIRRVDSLQAVQGTVPTETRAVSIEDPVLLRRLEIGWTDTGRIQVFEHSSGNHTLIHEFRQGSEGLIHENHRRGTRWLISPAGVLGSFRVQSDGGKIAAVVAILNDAVHLSWPQAERVMRWTRDSDWGYASAESTEESAIVWESSIDQTSRRYAILSLLSPESAIGMGRYQVEGCGTVTDFFTAAVNFQILAREFSILDAAWPYIFAPYLPADQEINVVTSSVFTEVLGGERVYYLGENLLDGDPATAWVEGHPGDGVGEWIDFLAGEASVFQTLTIRNGFQANEDWFRKNGRVRGYRILVDEEEIESGELPDTMGAYRIDLDAIEGRVLRFEVTSVYEGTDYSDLVISDIAIGLR